MEQSVATAVLCIVAGGVAAQYVATHMRIPAIVMLLALDFLVGPVLGLLHPSRDLGPSLRPLVGLAVAVVVFEGGLALDFRELRAAGEGVLRLTAVALPLNFVLGTAAARWIGGMGWGPATVYGAILVVTGPTVILPLLRQARLERRSAAFLKWEAIVNDPVGDRGNRRGARPDRHAPAPRSCAAAAWRLDRQAARLPSPRRADGPAGPALHRRRRAACA